VAAWEGASLFYDVLVGGFVGGATGTDDGNERGAVLCDSSGLPRSRKLDRTVIISRHQIETIKLRLDQSHPPLSDLKTVASCEL
jgi:hypothetical protein